MRQSLCEIHAAESVYHWAGINPIRKHTRALGTGCPFKSRERLRFPGTSSPFRSAPFAYGYAHSLPYPIPR
jgi:hypothetical protein